VSTGAARGVVRARRHHGGVQREGRGGRLRLLETIYFEYDADELRDDARASLDGKIAILNANPSLRIRVAGHCDERGSDEYNIALGRRRAEAPSVT